MDTWATFTIPAPVELTEANEPGATGYAIAIRGSELLVAREDGTLQTHATERVRVDPGWLERSRFEVRQELRQPMAAGAGGTTPGY